MSAWWVLAAFSGCGAVRADASLPAGVVVDGPEVEVGPREGRWFEVRIADAAALPPGPVTVQIGTSDPGVVVHAVDRRGRLVAPAAGTDGQAAFELELADRFHVGLAAGAPAKVRWDVRVRTEDPAMALTIVEIGSP